MPSISTSTLAKTKTSVNQSRLVLFFLTPVVIIGLDPIIQKAEIMGEVLFAANIYPPLADSFKLPRYSSISTFAGTTMPHSPAAAKPARRSAVR
jgi:hypothetical protein